MGKNQNRERISPTMSENFIASPRQDGVIAAGARAVAGLVVARGTVPGDLRE